MTTPAKPLLEVEGRSYFPLLESDDECGDNEIIWLRAWGEEGLPERTEVEPRIRELFSEAASEDEGILEIGLRVTIEGADVATVYAFVHDEGLEFGGWATGEYEPILVKDILGALGI